MPSEDPEMQNSRQNAGFFFAVLAATRGGDNSFRYPDNKNGEHYSTLKNIEDYARQPFSGIQDPFTVLWNTAPSKVKSKIVDYMKRNGRVSEDRWSRINTLDTSFMPEPPVPPEYRVHFNHTQH